LTPLRLSSSCWLSFIIIVKGPTIWHFFWEGGGFFFQQKLLCPKTMCRIFSCKNAILFFTKYDIAQNIFSALWAKQDILFQKFNGRSLMEICLDHSLWEHPNSLQRNHHLMVQLEMPLVKEHLLLAEEFYVSSHSLCHNPNYRR